MVIWRNKKETFSGQRFDSGLERAVYQILLLRQKSGEFSRVESQVHVLICGSKGHECSYKTKIESIVDFKCTRPDGSFIYVEAKGFPNEKWPLKLRLMRHYLDAPLELWEGTKHKPFLKETVISFELKKWNIKE